MKNQLIHFQKQIQVLHQIKLINIFLWDVNRLKVIHYFKIIFKMIYLKVLQQNNYLILINLL